MSEEPRAQAPFRHVVVATDFSVGAALAADRAALLPLVPRGRVTVVHVLPDALPKKLAAKAKDEAARKLQAVRRKLTAALAEEGGAGVTVNEELVLGNSYSAILGAAKSLGAELLVLGRHGPRPFRDLIIGSTASRVVGLAAGPVLVVSGRAQHRYQRSVVAVDLGDTSLSVMSAALRVFGPEGGEAVLVHAYRAPFESLMTRAVASRARDELKDGAERGLAALLRAIGDTNVAWSRAASHGDARAVVLAQASRRTADLIVVGSHVRPRLGTLLGTTAEGVLEAATCDVLVAGP